MTVQVEQVSPADHAGKSVDESAKRATNADLTTKDNPERLSLFEHVVEADRKLADAQTARVSSGLQTIAGSKQDQVAKGESSTIHHTEKTMDESGKRTAKVDLTKDNPETFKADRKLADVKNAGRRSVSFFKHPVSGVENAQLAKGASQDTQEHCSNVPATTDKAGSEEALIERGKAQIDPLNVTDSPQMEPLPQTPLAPSRAIAGRPGAYSATPGSDLFRSNDIRFSLVGAAPLEGQLRSSLTYDMSGNVPLELLRVSTKRNEMDLSVARLVEGNEERNQELPQAEHCTQDSDRNSNATKTPRQGFFFVGLGLVVTAVVVFLVVLLATEFSGISSDESASNGIESQESIVPTASPTKLDMKQHIIGMLPVYTRDAIRQPDSPQMLAFGWLINDPMISSYPEWRILQRYALAVLYYSTAGQAWQFSQNWLSYDHHECLWYTHPIFIPPEFEAAVNAAGQFFYIADKIRALKDAPCGSALSNSTTNAAFDPETFKYLFLYQNNLVGTFPQEIFLLTSLEAINLAVNPQLEGTIPSQVGHLGELQTLTFFGNPAIDGTLPTEIGLLSNLVELVFIGTKLHGTLPSEILQLSNYLEMLFLDSEADRRSPPFISGPIYSELGALSLKGLLLAGDMAGTIPTELGQLQTGLLYLGLRNNPRLGGSLPSEIGRLTNVDRMLLRNNSLTGTIPKEVGNMSTLLEFHVQHNQLSGQVPSQLGTLRACQRVRLEGNVDIWGEIPDKLCSLGQFDPVSVHPSLDSFVSFECNDMLCGCNWCPCNTPV